MVKISSHHRPGHPMAAFHAKDAYVPSKAWPETCMVQWGGGGVVLGSKPYQTAFFEAFPEDNSGGFIRGEGSSIADAEANAFEKWQSRIGCVHEWTRRRSADNLYLNGLGFCRKCRASKSVFHPVVTLGDWKRPIGGDELYSIASGFIREHAWDKDDQAARSRKWRTRLRLRAKQAGLQLPPIPPPQTTEELFKEDPYADACMEAVLAYYVRERKRILAEAGGSIMDHLFKGLRNALLEGEAKRRGLIDGEGK